MDLTNLSTGWLVVLVLTGVILSSLLLTLAYDRYRKWLTQRRPKFQGSLTGALKIAALLCLLVFIAGLFVPALAESSVSVVAFALAGALFMLSDDIPARAEREAVERERLHALPVGKEGPGSFFLQVLLPFTLQFWGIVLVAALQSQLLPTVAFPFKGSIVVLIGAAWYWYRMKLDQWAFKKAVGASHLTFLELASLRVMMVILLVGIVVLFDLVYRYSSSPDKTEWGPSAAGMWYGVQMVFICSFLLPGRAVR